MKQSSAQIDEEIYEVDINLARSSWKIGMINRSENETGDFETRLYDYLEDTELWLEVTYINDKERVVDTGYTLKMVWNTRRGTYMMEEGTNIWALSEISREGEAGVLLMEGGELNDRYYNIGREVVRSTSNELIVWRQQD